MQSISRIAVAGGTLLIAVTTLAFATPNSHSKTSSTDAKQLEERVADLENLVIQLKHEMRDAQLASRLSGHWIEESHIESGRQDSQADEVAWRLANDISSDRYVLVAEVSASQFGPFSVDSSKQPAWINFEMRRFGDTHSVKGIVKYTFGRAEISLPSKLFDDGKFLDPPRHKGFTSTKGNGYAVYKLIRESFKKTGVWQ